MGGKRGGEDSPWSHAPLTLPPLSLEVPLQQPCSVRRGATGSTTGVPSYGGREAGAAPRHSHEHVSAALEVDGGVDGHSDGDGHHNQRQHAHAHCAHLRPAHAGRCAGGAALSRGGRGQHSRHGTKAAQRDAHLERQQRQSINPSAPQPTTHREVAAPVAVRVARHPQQRRRDAAGGDRHVHPVQERALIGCGQVGGCKEARTTDSAARKPAVTSKRTCCTLHARKAFARRLQKPAAAAAARFHYPARLPLAETTRAPPPPHPPCAPKKALASVRRRPAPLIAATHRGRSGSGRSRKCQSCCRHGGGARGGAWEKATPRAALVGAVGQWMRSCTRLASAAESEVMWEHQRGPGIQLPAVGLARHLPLRSLGLVAVASLQTPYRSQLAAAAGAPPKAGSAGQQGGGVCEGSSWGTAEPICAHIEAPGTRKRQRSGRRQSRDAAAR